MDPEELERMLYPEETEQQREERVISELLPDAVREMATLSHFAKDPQVREAAREYMRGNDGKWKWWFMGYEFARQQANQRDGYPDNLFGRKPTE